MWLPPLQLSPWCFSSAASMNNLQDIPSKHLHQILVLLQGTHYQWLRKTWHYLPFIRGSLVFINLACDRQPCLSSAQPCMWSTAWPQPCLSSPPKYCLWLAVWPSLYVLSSSGSTYSQDSFLGIIGGHKTQTSPRPRELSAKCTVIKDCLNKVSLNCH